MIATPLGEAFVRRATAILNDVRRAQDEVEQICGGNAVGHITVGLSIAAHCGFCRRCSSPFGGGFPKFTFTLSRGFYPTLEQGLQDGSVDFYVGPDPGLKLPRTLQKTALLRAGEPFSVDRNIRLQMRLRSRTGRRGMDHDVDNTEGGKELGALFKRYGLPEPTLAMRS